MSVTLVGWCQQCPDMQVELGVTYRADDNQDRQNPHQHFGDVTNDDHHDQGQN